MIGSKARGGGGGRDAGDLVPEGGYCQDYQELVELVEAQGYSNILKLHNLDVVAELSAFMVQHPHLHFRLVFMDAGMYDVMKAAIPVFWERLLPGGIMIFDQFAHELAPGEIAAVRECLPDVPMFRLPHAWMPNAYTIKTTTP